MWPQNVYGQPQYQQQPYQYNQPPQMPYGNVPPVNNNQFATEAIDWDSVSAIDPDLIRMTGDLTQLQPFISKFVSTNLSTYESQILAHPLSIRLCSILQVSLKYMSNVQKELLAKIEEKDRQISKQQHEFKKLAIAYEKSDELLRKQMRPSERCPLCLKRFKNFDFLDQHIERRHPEHVDEWLSIRNKKPMPKQNQNDINNIMERIDALQKSLRKDRERRGHHHNRRGKSYEENDENIQTLRQELHDQQDQLMATEAMEDELIMTKRDDMKSELDTAVDDLNASWIAWSNNNKKNNNNSNQKSKATKPLNGGDEFDNMYNFNDNLGNKFDHFDDQFELNDNFNTKCHSDDDDDLMNNHNFNENPMNHFQFQMIQNSQVPNQQQQLENEINKSKEEIKEKKSSKKPKRSLFGRKKSKHNSEQQQNDVFINNQIPYSNLNDFDTPQTIVNNISNDSTKSKKRKIKSRQFQNQVQLPAKKKTLPDDVKELIAKARQIIVRKFTPNYDESTVNHVMRSIEKKMNAFRQQFASNNELPEQVAESLQSKVEEDQNEYFATKRRVVLRIDNEAPVKHCTLFDSSFTTESSAMSTANPNEDNQNNKIQQNQTKPIQNQDQSQIEIPSKPKKQQQQTQQQQQQQQQQFQEQMNRIQQQHQQPNVSQSSISAKNKRKRSSTNKNPTTKNSDNNKNNNDNNNNNNNDNADNNNNINVDNKNNNVSFNIDDIPKPNNSQFTTSYSNYATSVSTTISPSNTPINGENKTKPKSSYSYIVSNSLNINETVNQIQEAPDQNQAQNETEDEKQEAKKLQFVKPRPAIQCKKHFKSAGHTVHSPFPMLSPPTTPNEGENIINDANQAANGVEYEYVYDEEEEEEEEVKEEVHQNIVINSAAQEIVVIEEEEEEHESVPTSSFRRPPPSQSTSQSQSRCQNQNQSTSQSQTQSQSQSQPTIQSETANYETFDESKMINMQNISPPKLNKHAKNEITSSTDLMFDDSQQLQPLKIARPNNRAKNEITSSTDTMYEVPRASNISNINKSKQNDTFDSLDQSETSTSIPLQQAKKMDQAVFKTPQNNNNNNNNSIAFALKSSEVTNDNITETTATNEAAAATTATAQYEYEYYTDDEGTKSDGEVASYQQQNKEMKENEKFEKEIEKEESEINIQIQHQKEEEKDDLEPFLVAPENSIQSQNSALNTQDQIAIQNSHSNLNQDSKQLHSEYYSSSSTNLFYRFDSSTNSKSRSKEFQNTNLDLNEAEAGVEAEVEVEANKTPTDDDPVKQTVYKPGKVGSMDNIVSFDEVKSIDSIERIPKGQDVSKASVQSDEDSQFNFDSFVEKSNGGDSFITESCKSLNFRQSTGISNQQQQTPPQQQQHPPQQQQNISSNTSSDSFISKQRNLLASKYGVAPQQQQRPAPPPPQNSNSNNNAAAFPPPAAAAAVDDDDYEYEEEEEEEEYENIEFENANQKQQSNQRQNGSGIGLNASGGGSGISGVKKFNVIDIFKQSSNSSLLKSKKPANSKNTKSFLGSKVQKTFAGSSSAAQDDDEFDYSRGPPMKDDDDNYNDFGDDNFGGGAEINDKIHSTSGLSKFVDDSEGPPLLSKKKNDDSLISNDDFNL